MITPIFDKLVIQIPVRMNLFGIDNDVACYVNTNLC